METPVQPSAKSQEPSNQIAGALSSLPLALPALPPLAEAWSELILALLVLGATFAALWDGKIDATSAMAIIGFVGSAYPGFRAWIKAKHLDVCAQVLMAQTGPHADVFHAAAAALAPQVSGSSFLVSGSSGAAPTVAALPVVPPGGGSGVGPKLALLAAAVSGFWFLVLTAGCASDPFYVSGVNAGVTVNPEDQEITGGTVGLTIAPKAATAAAKKKQAAPDGKIVVPLSDVAQPSRLWGLPASFNSRRDAYWPHRQDACATKAPASLHPARPPGRERDRPQRV